MQVQFVSEGASGVGAAAMDLFPEGPEEKSFLRNLERTLRRGEKDEKDDIVVLASNSEGRLTLFQRPADR